jgi:hypothetical protein
MTQRKGYCHYIPPETSSQTLHYALFVDTETKQVPMPGGGVEHHLWFGWAAYCRRKRSGKWAEPVWYRFETPAEFAAIIDGLMRKGRRLYLFAHNAGFDLPVVHAFEELPMIGLELKFGIIESPPFIVRWERDKGSLLALDTMNWWPTSLASIGESVGLAKLEMPEEDAGKLAWDLYCRRDVEVVMRRITTWADFLRDNEMGGFDRTIAGQAMRYYRHSHMSTRICAHQSARADALAREAYHGGRCDSLFIGSGGRTLYKLDVNSMYPYVMVGNKYPTEVVRSQAGPQLRDLKSALRKHLVIARVYVDTSQPALPFKTERHLTFPTGRFWTTLTTPELEWALQEDVVRACAQLYAFERADLFSSYVSHCYRERQRAAEEGRTLDAEAWKKLLNTLYGKFGQAGHHWEECAKAASLDICQWVHLDADTREVTHMRQFGGLIQRLEVKPESWNSVPAIAAHVTAYARMYLWKLMRIAGDRHVYYMDTDSLVVDDVGLERLTPRIHPGMLGALKLEGSTSSWEFSCPKHYRFGEEVKLKGVRSRAVDLGGGVYEQDQWTSLKGLIRKGRAHTPETIQIRKEIRASYVKGTVGADGWVIPFERDDPRSNGNADGLRARLS